MALLIPTGFAQATMPLKHSLLTREAVVTFGVDVSGYGGNYIGAANTIMGLWDTHVNPVMDSNVTAGPTRLAVGQDGGENLQVAGSTNFPGGRTISSVACNTAALVKKLTNRGGRRGRGRFYVPWCLEDTDVDEAGVIQPSELVLVGSAMEAFRAALAAGSTDMVVLHNEGNSVPGAPNEVTLLVTDGLIGTQRRRLGR